MQVFGEATLWRVHWPGKSTLGRREGRRESDQRGEGRKRRRWKKRRRRERMRVAETDRDREEQRQRQRQRLGYHEDLSYRIKRPDKFYTANMMI